MIVITGGAGFIGSNLVAGLAARGLDELVVCDRLGTGDKWRNIAKRGLADIIPPETLLTWLNEQDEPIEAIFHLGAISDTTARDGDAVVAANFTLSQSLWRWCAAHDARFIFASSAATYGDGSHGFDDSPSDQDMAQLRPLNLYGWSKLAFDRRVIHQVASAATLPPQWAGLRFFNVYGPNEWHKGAQQSLIPQLYRQIQESGRARLFKSHHPDYDHGGQLRDFVSVDDCVGVMLWLYDNPDTNGIFNIGTGKARSFADLATSVFQAMGKDMAIDYIDMPETIRHQYQYFTQARIERLRAAGYDRPFTALEDGVRRYVVDHLSQADPYR
ncbi:MAG: ADP-glyceromanno-heptose 6-epimerase [Alphaproteobacteria bacterium]